MTEVERGPDEGGDVVHTADVGADLVEAIRTGDDAIFAAIVRSWSPLLLRTATALTGDRDAAQSVVRETWQRVLTDVTTVQPPLRPRTWVFVLMVSTIDLPAPAATDVPDEPAVAPVRFLPPEHDRWPRHWALPPAAWPSTTDSRLGVSGVRDALWSALAEMPPLQRVVVSLRDVAGCEVLEISQIVRQRPDQVRLLLHQGRSALRTRLESHFDSPVNA